MPRTGVIETAHRIYRKLNASHRAEIGVLRDTVDAATATVVFDTPRPGDLRAGSEIAVDLEDMRIRSVDTDKQTCTVLRGWLDSEPAAHAAGTVIFLDPKYSMHSIVDAMREELAAWGPQLYRPVAADVAYAGTAHLAMPETFIGMFGLLGAWRQTTVAGSIDAITDDRWPYLELDMARAEAGWDGAASGMLATVRSWNDWVPAGVVRLVAAMPFDPSTVAAGNDLVIHSSLAPGLVDVLELGVRVRLIADKGIAETGRDVQDEPRRAAEAPPGSAMPMTNALYATYRYRKQEEINKLVARYPIRVAM